MEASTEHRIHLLAIAIQGMDSDDADRLLGYMPAPMAQRIRAQMTRLDGVSDSERQVALETIEDLLDSELVAESTISVAAEKTPIHLIDRDFVLEDQPIEVLVKVLANERPIVIATILRHVSSRFGQSIVQRLDLDLAKEALDWIPKLEPTAGVILDGILAELQAQVRTVCVELESKHQGEAKFRELLSVLGATGTSIDAVATERAIELGEIGTNQQVQTTTFGLGGSKTMNSNPMNSNQSGPRTSPPNPSRPFVIPLNLKSSRDEALEVLLELDDLDLLSVLYSHRVDDVKRFLAGSNKTMRTRIENLTPSSGLKKLRRELACASIIDEKTWLELASRFTETAVQLQGSGTREQEPQSNTISGSIVSDAGPALRIPA